MYEGDVVVISSSPEPEPDIPLRPHKGKARATNERFETPNPDGVPAVLVDDEEEEEEDDDDEPLASGSGSRNVVQPPVDPIEATMQQVLDVIPNVEKDHLNSMVVQYIGQGYQDVSVIISINLKGLELFLFLGWHGDHLSPIRASGLSQSRKTQE